MSPPLTWQVDSHRNTARLTVDGRPDQQSVNRLIAALERRVDRHPGSMVVDLAGMQAGDGTTHAAAVSLPGRLAASCGTTALVCQSKELGWGSLSRHLARARELIDGRPVPHAPTVTEQILPVSGGPRRGRELAMAACLILHLEHLIGRVTLIASELISHMTWCSSSLMTLSMAHRDDVLHLVVRGATAAGCVPVDPQASDHLSLWLIHQMADCWGHLQDDGDTVIWAALAATPS